jgi:hypothetical protein
MNKNHYKLIAIVSTFLFFILLNISLGIFALMGIIAFLGFMVVFFVFDLVFHARFRYRHYIIMAVIIFLGNIMGSAYFYIPSYDKVLHFSMPFFASFIVFYSLRNLNIKFELKVVFTFALVFFFLGLLEISEYLLDQFFDLKLQGVYIYEKIQGSEVLQAYLDQNGDTMTDLIFGLMSCWIFSIYKLIGYKLVKN